MSFFGLDIGSESVKLVELKGGGRKIAVAALGYSPLSRSMESESKEDLLRVATDIKKLVSVSRVSTRRVVANLPEDKVFSRVIELPPMEEKELSSAIKWEADQFVPIPLTDAILDFEILQSTGKSNRDRVRVYLVASPKSLVEKYIDVIEMAGLHVLGLETDMLAITRAVVPSSQEPTLVIDLGARSTDLAITDQGQVLLTRSIPSAGRAITRALTLSLGLENDQAESYKRAYGVDSKQFEGKMSAAIGPVLTVVVEEIKKAISYFETEHQDRKLERMIMTGGSAEMPDIIPYFAKELALEIEVGNPFQRVVNQEEVMAKIKGGSAPIFAVAFGLALKKI